MIFYAARLSYIVSSHEGVPDNGTRSYLVDADTSSYAYGDGGPYDYDESGLADRFSNIVHTADQPLWDGCNQSHLGVITELVDIKWNDDVDLEYCKFCGDDRYQPARGRDLHRKKSPYFVLRYLPLTPACREEPHNVWLGLCTDGLAPHGQYSRTYSCWLAIIISKNLPPGMCMSSEYKFLRMVIPGPSNSKRLIDVYLELLIEELLQLWHVGVKTYNHATNRAFMMRAALMWTVNSLPAYGMTSGWSTTGVMGCSVCMDDTRAFHLQHDRKVCYFNCHRQFLLAYHPYRRNKKAFTKNRVENKIARSSYPGRASGATKKRWLNGPERHIIESYILTNCEVITPYYEYNFQPECHNTGKSTINCMVCVKSSSYTDEKNDSYGIIEEIIQLTCPLIPNLHIVLFKCRWVDPVRGMKEHPRYHLVDVNFKKLYQNDDPFILAQQAVQVYFTGRILAGGSSTSSCSGYDNQPYDLHDPNSLQVVLEAAGISRRQLHEYDDENEDEFEDSGEDDEIDDEEYEAT
ncbi:UNVERIFIED_CONTAM: hypothetical protein Sradi_2534900 [Sesamum radiatum]|uniref:DUF4216 domain-containing protein n=1 Tax=Sesamum radiatum TaxID=300843 RepID=A0AAW2SN19_SESRA